MQTTICLTANALAPVPTSFCARECQRGILNPGVRYSRKAALGLRVVLWGAWSAITLAVALGGTKPCGAVLAAPVAPAASSLNASSSSMLCDGAKIATVRRSGMLSICKLSSAISYIGKNSSSSMPISLW